MADDKLKTGPESPGPEQPGEATAEKSPEAPAPEKAVEAAELGAGPESQPERSVLSGMGGDAPARTAPGEVVVDFDKINELMSQRRAAAREAVSKAEAQAVEGGSPKHGDEAFRDLFGNEEKPPWEKSLDEIKEEEKAQKRRGRPKKAKDKAEPDKPEKGPGPRTGRPAKADKAARGKSPSPGVLDKVVCPPSSRQGNNLHFTHEISAYQPYRAGTGLYAASRQSWTSIGVRTPSPRWRRRKL